MSGSCSQQRLSVKSIHLDIKTPKNVFSRQSKDLSNYSFFRQRAFSEGRPPEESNENSRTAGGRDTVKGNHKEGSKLGYMGKSSRSTVITRCGLNNKEQKQSLKNKSRWKKLGLSLQALSSPIKTSSQALNKKGNSRDFIAKLDKHIRELSQNSSQKHTKIKENSKSKIKESKNLLKKVSGDNQAQDLKTETDKEITYLRKSLGYQNIKNFDDIQNMPSIKYMETNSSETLSGIVIRKRSNIKDWLKSFKDKVCEREQREVNFLKPGSKRMTHKKGATSINLTANPHQIQTFTSKKKSSLFPLKKPSPGLKSFNSSKKSLHSSQAKNSRVSEAEVLDGRLESIDRRLEELERIVNRGGILTFQSEGTKQVQHKHDATSMISKLVEQVKSRSRESSINLRKTPVSLTVSRSSKSPLRPSAPPKSPPCRMIYSPQGNLQGGKDFDQYINRLKQRRHTHYLSPFGKDWSLKR